MAGVYAITYTSSNHKSISSLSLFSFTYAENIEQPKVLTLNHSTGYRLEL